MVGVGVVEESEVVGEETGSGLISLIAGRPFIESTFELERRIGLGLECDGTINWPGGVMGSKLGLGSTTLVVKAGILGSVDVVSSTDSFTCALTLGPSLGPSCGFFTSGRACASSSPSLGWRKE